MGHWQSLADAILDEDRQLRRCLAACPAQLRDRRSPGGTLSFKETLAHISFWDDFAVRFFAARVGMMPVRPAVPGDFDAESREVIAAAALRPFGDVLAEYRRATGALLTFLAQQWDRLSPAEQDDFWIPLRHRRHHRLALQQAAGGSGHEQELSNAAGA